ncbi:MAG TPA: hypothetical protein VGT41_06560 [Candidatus Babeliales bacterium]|nr:hypothetical protein [Candidatus Babeliales bacterium]
MNRLFRCTVFLLLFLTQISVCDVQEFALLPVTPVWYPVSHVVRQPAEGFSPDTLIKTVNGYVLIHDLSEGDIVVGLNGDQKILYVQQNYLDRCVQLRVDDQVINVALGQQFYLHDNALKSACDLEIGDILYGGSCVYAKDIVDEPQLFYALSTEQNSFFIYPDMYVHNFDVATITVIGSLLLGAIEISNPVVAVVGEMLSLYLFIMKNFMPDGKLVGTISPSDENLPILQIALKNRDIVSKARNYYEIKRKELLKLYQDLVKIKTDLDAFVRPNQAHILDFSKSFLREWTSQAFDTVALPDLSYELGLNPVAKEQLMQLRDDELERLQQAIIDQHLILALHVNEVIVRYDKAWEDATSFSGCHNQEVSCWNRNLNNVPCDVALRLYAALFIWRELLNNLEQKTKEMQGILSYYQKLKNNFFVSQTTTIFQILPAFVQKADIAVGYVQHNKQIVLSNMLISEACLTRYRILTAELIKKNQAAAEKYRAARDDSKDGSVYAKGIHAAVKAILDRQATGEVYTGYAPGPDDDEDFFKNLEKKADKRRRLPGGGKYYRDPETGLWWSKDNGSNHAGVHYKVYLERKTYLEWIWDVCLKTGRIMDKHKGPIGRTIRMKDLIPF